MKNNDVVSIIIPVYNAEKYIATCIESLIAQDYENIEVILVDDGSTDSSPQICDKYSKNDSRIKVIHKKNGGVSAARNDGIQKSKGEWITFVDADDWVEENYISYLLKNAKNNDSEISLTTFPNKVNESNKLNNCKKGDDSITTISGINAAIMMMYYKIVISSWNKMFKKSLLIDNSILFREDLIYGEGFDFVINAMLNANSVTIGHEKIYNYRVDNENSAMTLFKEKMVTGSIDSQNSIKERIEKKFENDNTSKKILLSACKYSYWHTHCDCINTIYGSGNNKNYVKLTNYLAKECKKNAISSFNKNVPFKDKIKGIIYMFSPKVAAAFINKMRIRKFTKN